MAGAPARVSPTHPATSPEPAAQAQSASPAAPAAAQPVEIEAKLRASRRAFDALAGAAELAGWRVVGRRDVGLRDTYWDTPDGHLARAGCTLRLRELRPTDSAPDKPQQAELTLKGPAAPPVRPSPRPPARAGGRDGAQPSLSAGQPGSGAVWSRTELTVAAPSGSGPADWARLPDARPLLSALAELGVPQRAGVPDGLRPDVVLLNPRREILLEADGSRAVLALDEVAVEGAPYRRRYVEVELIRGDPAALDRLVVSLLAGHRLRPSRRGKVQAARAWLAGRRPVQT